MGTTTAIVAARRGWLEYDLLADGDDPFMLEEFCCSGPFIGVTLEASSEEVDT